MTPMTPIERVRTHAAKIRKLLSSQASEEEQESMGQVRIWRALYEIKYSGHIRALALIQGKDQPLLAQFQLHADEAIPTWGTVIQLSGAYVSVEEIAVFLGLDEIDPVAFTWTLTWAE